MPCNDKKPITTPRHAGADFRPGGALRWQPGAGLGLSGVIDTDRLGDDLAQAQWRSLCLVEGSLGAIGLSSLAELPGVPQYRAGKFLVDVWRVGVAGGGDLRDGGARRARLAASVWLLSDSRADYGDLGNCRIRGHRYQG